MLKDVTVMSGDLPPRCLHSPHRQCWTNFVSAKCKRTNNEATPKKVLLVVFVVVVVVFVNFDIVDFFHHLHFGSCAHGACVFQNITKTED